MKLINRELSWLSFNERVLQEALDEEVPIIERMRFLGIYSNNMDEFFRVRVAYIRRMIALEKRKVDGFSGTPAELLEEIRNVVIKQQKKFQVAYTKILNLLEREKIFHITNEELSPEQIKELSAYFNRRLKHAIVPIILNKKTPFPQLKETGIYLAVEMHATGKEKYRTALIKIPDEFPRFYRMKDKNKEFVILLDDIIRLNMSTIFSIFVFDLIEAYTFKFSRDAVLDLDDDISISFMEKIRKSLGKRSLGQPVRFVYDEEMPNRLLNYLSQKLNLHDGVNSIPGGKYHNFKDFISFPDFKRPDFVYPKRSASSHPRLVNQRSLIKEIAMSDVLLHFPYQRFDHVVDLLREAAIDPKVRSIKINVYRVARKSQIMNALINAVSNGKQVSVIIELQARFDEENNLYWANTLREAGAKVSFGKPEEKVHSKLMQIHRIGSKRELLITYIGTGNFQEKTARIYEDLGLLTVDERIGEEVRKVFDVLDGFNNDYRFEHLLIAPFSMRNSLEELILTEIKNAEERKEAFIRIKLNNLVDSEIISLLYKASQAGVKVDLLIRGVCCVVPGVEGLSENITIRSIVGRYLEHSRYMIFANGGELKYYLSSADLMERNLDRRIEVGCPIYDEAIQQQLRKIFEIQWKGNVKSRIIDEAQKNVHYKRGSEHFDSQSELYDFYKLAL
ncbi:MAG: polyphosphate kinase [Crocinitomicaceae bacterium]|jgi:polyphosphate kinase